MLAATGSTMTAAIFPLRALSRRRTAARSLYGRLSVCFARSAGTPGLSGMPSVSAPEPALTSIWSAWPW